MPEKLKPSADDWKIDEAVTKPCAHARPQDESQLHGVCIFCWRDRCAVLAAAVRRPEPGRCETCKWWRLLTEDGEDPVGWCKCEPALEVGSDSITCPTFGCIFHAPRGAEGEHEPKGGE